MKFKLLIAFSLFISTCFAQKTTTNTVTSNNNSVNITEDDNKYEFHSTYDKTLADKVLDYMDQTIGKDGGVKFKNAQLDAQMTLNNHASFYVKSYPGKLDLKFDKRKNSAELYTRFKSMCEGIRDIIHKK